MEFEEKVKEILKPNTTANKRGMTLGEILGEGHFILVEKNKIAKQIITLAKKECLGCLPKHKLVKLDTEDFRWREGFNQAISKAEKAVEDSFNGKK